MSVVFYICLPPLKKQTKKKQTKQRKNKLQPLKNDEVSISTKFLTLSLMGSP